MDDIPVPIPENPTCFMDELRYFIRSKNLAYRTELKEPSNKYDYGLLLELGIWRLIRMITRSITNTTKQPTKIESSTTCAILNCYACTRTN